VLADLGATARMRGTVTPLTDRTYRRGAHYVAEIIEPRRMAVICQLGGKPFGAFLPTCFAAEREGAESFTFLSLGFFSVTLILGFSENFSLAIVFSFFAIVVRATRRPSP
jgi:hypothetical protein